MTEQLLDLAIIDFDEALDNLEGDVELLHDVVDIFMDRSLEQIESIRRAIADNDVETVMIQSHGMKGGASNFCAKRFGRSAGDLEMLSKNGSLESAEEKLRVMAAELSTLEKVIGEVDWKALEAAQPC